MCSWTGLGWLEFCAFHCLPNSAWADGNLAEAARSWARWVKHQNHSQPNPCLRAHGTPCRGKAKILKISRTSNSHPDANLCLPFSGNNLCDREQYNFRNAWNVQLTTVSVQIGRLSLHEARILRPLLMRTRWGVALLRRQAFLYCRGLGDGKCRITEIQGWTVSWDGLGWATLLEPGFHFLWFLVSINHRTWV